MKKSNLFLECTIFKQKISAKVVKKQGLALILHQYFLYICKSLGLEKGFLVS